MEYNHKATSEPDVKRLEEISTKAELQSEAMSLIVRIFGIQRDEIAALRRRVERLETKVYGY